VRVAITGAGGFLGWHVGVRLGAVSGHEVLPITRSVFDNDDSLRVVLEKADAVVHLAGINRDTPRAVETGNVALAVRLATALDAADSAPSIIYANSVHAAGDTPYGRGKRRAAAVLRDWADRRGTALVDVVLENVFGEGCRPNYNSFVATFCHRLAHGEVPEVQADRRVQLLHAQDAATFLLDSLNDEVIRSTVVESSGRAALVSEVRDELADLSATYGSGRIPDLGDPFTLRLFNTYRSYLYPQWYPQPLPAKADHRGAFMEAAQVRGGESQTSFSTTNPGMIRGDHFHLRKVERFVVLRGQARIAIRPVGRAHVHTFDVSGDRPVFVDMPTLHTHNITNTGNDELWTLFWISEIFNVADADTYAERVG
jgi:UDP-2-acetamido-2,6-beta-L-arabino-hexul-4-ose reductase